jgi:hypothetical protein
MTERFRQGQSIPCHDVELEIGMVHAVQAPEHRRCMGDNVLALDRGIKQYDRKDHLEPRGQGQDDEHSPASGFGTVGVRSVSWPALPPVLKAAVKCARRAAFVLYNPPSEFTANRQRDTRMIPPDETGASDAFVEEFESPPISVTKRGRRRTHTSRNSRLSLVVPHLSLGPTSLSYRGPRLLCSCQEYR